MSIMDTLYKYRPQIMIGFGCIGIAATAVLAGRASVVADKILNRKRRWENKSATKPEDRFDHMTIVERVEYGDDDDKVEAAKVAVKELAPVYLPVVAAGVGTAALFLGANHIQLTRIAAMDAVYTLSQETLHKYKDKIAGLFGKKKLEEIQDEIQQDTLRDRNPEEELVHQTGNGDYLCYDVPSGRYFRSNIEEVRKAEVQLTKDLMYGPVSLNRFYDLLDLPGIPLGDMVGFDPNGDMINVQFSTQISPTNEPAFVLDYVVYPMRYRLDI